jgi:Domain of unknown function (DUF222)
MGDPVVVALVAGFDVVDVEGCDSAACGDLLRQARRVRGWLDRFEARVTSRMTALYESAAAPPAAAEHGRHSGVSAGEGLRREKRSKAIEEAPSFGDALESGAIAAEHVDALANATATVTEAVKTELLAGQDALAVKAAALTPEQFARYCRDRIRRIERDHGIERNKRQRNETFLAWKQNLATGMIDGRFSFHPELANQFTRAVDREVAAMIAAGEAAGDPEFVDRTYQRSRLAAEALGRLIAAIRPTEADVVVICDHETVRTGRLHDHSICETSDGLPLPPASIARLLCQGRLTPVIVNSDGVVLDAGRTIRHANRHQRRALRAMYRTCAIAGCEAPFDRCEIHHIDWYEHGGPTDIANLLPVCSRHHHLVHEGCFSLRLAPDRTLTVTQPDGTVYSTSRPEHTDTRRDRQRRRRTAA